MTRMMMPLVLLARKVEYQPENVKESNQFQSLQTRCVLSPRKVILTMTQSSPHLQLDRKSVLVLSDPRSKGFHVYFYISKFLFVG